MSRFGTSLNKYAQQSFIMGDARPINPHLALQRMVKTAFTFSRDCTLALIARRYLLRPRGYACAGEPRRDGNRGNHSAGAGLSAGAIEGYQILRSPIPAARRYAACRIFLGGDFFQPVFAHLLDQGGPLQRQHARRFRDDAIGISQCGLNTLQFHLLDLSLEVDDNQFSPAE